MSLNLLPGLRHLESHWVHSRDSCIPQIPTCPGSPGEPDGCVDDFVPPRPSRADDTGALVSLTGRLLWGSHRVQRSMGILTLAVPGPPDGIIEADLVSAEEFEALEILPFGGHQLTAVRERKELVSPPSFTSSRAQVTGDRQRSHLGVFLGHFLLRETEAQAQLAVTLAFPQRRLGGTLHRCTPVGCQLTVFTFSGPLRSSWLGPRGEHIRPWSRDP